MITGKSLEKVDRICQDLPRSAGICQKWTEVDTIIFLSAYFRGFGSLKSAQGSGHRGRRREQGAGGGEQNAGYET